MFDNKTARVSLTRLRKKQTYKINLLNGLTQNYLSHNITGYNYLVAVSCEYYSFPSVLLVREDGGESVTLERVCEVVEGVASLRKYVASTWNLPSQTVTLSYNGK